MKICPSKICECYIVQVQLSGQWPLLILIDDLSVEFLDAIHTLWEAMLAKAKSE